MSTPQGSALLQIRGLRTRFTTPRGPITAVDGVDLDILAGETVAVVGESGSGKSVTALSVLRLFNRGDRAALDGTVLWQGRDGVVVDLATLPEAQLATLRGRDIAVIFQDPGASLNPVFSIGSQITEVLHRHRPEIAGHGASAREAAVQWLREVGIADPERRLNAFAHQLSGGMRQRVMIAIALACAPRLLIADEPTTALDVTIQAQIMRLLAELKSRLGMALLFITHDLALVAEIADRIVVMYAGQVVESGHASEVLSAPRHPYTRALLQCRPRRHYRDGAADERVLQPIGGAPPRPGEIAQGCRFAPRCAVAQDDCRLHPVPLVEADDRRVVRCLHWKALA